MIIPDNSEKYKYCFMPCTIKICLENKKLGSGITGFEKRGILIKKKCNTLCFLRNVDIETPKCGKHEVGIKLLQRYGWCVVSALANLRMWDTDLAKMFLSCSSQGRPIFDILRGAKQYPEQVTQGSSLLLLSSSSQTAAQARLYNPCRIWWSTWNIFMGLHFCGAEEEKGFSMIFLQGHKN